MSSVSMITINGLPNEILERIFIYSTPWIDSSIQLCKVSQQWNTVMKHRLSLVKYLIWCDQFGDDSFIDQDGKKHLSPGYFPSGEVLYCRDGYKSFDKAQSHLDLLPNLMIFDPFYIDCDDQDKFRKLINSKPKIKGLGVHRCKYEPVKKTVITDNITMLHIADDCDGGWISRHCSYFDKLTQIYCGEHDMKPLFVCLRSPKVKRLHVRKDYSMISKPNSSMNMYQGPILEDLEILERGYDEEDFHESLNHFLQFCPNLKSFYLFLDIEQPEEFVGTLRTYDQVENFVVESYLYLDDRGPWSQFEKVLSMFPSLKIFSVRNFRIEKEEELLYSLRSLPKLDLLDIQEFDGQLEGISFKSQLKKDKLITQYREIHGRQIKCKISHPKTIPLNKPVGIGFDFMKNIFPTDFNDSPYYLIE